jgi:hypothetical protein
MRVGGEVTVLRLRKPSSKGRLDYCEALSTPDVTKRNVSDTADLILQFPRSPLLKLSEKVSEWGFDHAFSQRGTAKQGLLPHFVRP